MKTKKAKIRHVVLYLVPWILIGVILSLTACTKKPQKFVDSPIDSVKVQSMISEQFACEYYNQTDYSMHLVNIKDNAKIQNFLLSTDSKIIDDLARLCIRKYGVVSDALLYDEYMNYYSKLLSEINDTTESIYHKQMRERQKIPSQREDTIIGINMVKKSNTVTKNGTDTNNL